ncbi:MAG: hypothetical protein A2W27_01815 [Deltaproteobacteria bacterium RBG_16_44_11]|nr:MAG: hypothetical protein A2W27_01815 [Deltaproteobacteria bacterium RBG_16_44_11]
MRGRSLWQTQACPPLFCHCEDVVRGNLIIGKGLLPRIGVRGRRCLWRIRHDIVSVFARERSERSNLMQSLRVRRGGRGNRIIKKESFRHIKKISLNL